MSYFATAQDSDDPEAEERELSVDVASKRVEIESARESGDTEDYLYLEISGDGEARVAIEYASANATTESEAEMSVSFYTIIEFVDNNDNGVFDGEDTDEIIQVYEMSSVGYSDLEYTTEETGDGVTEHIVSIQSSDGVFKVVFHVVGSFTEVAGRDLKPTSVKIDIIINDFDFQSEESKLALFSEAESSSELETGQEGVDDQTENDEAISGTGDGAFAFYSWEQSAEVDGETTDVLASYVEQSASYQELYLNYESGASIVHDPILGISLPGDDGSAGFAVSISPLMLLIPLIVIPVFRRYKMNS